MKGIEEKDYTCYLGISNGYCVMLQIHEFPSIV